MDFFRRVTGGLLVLLILGLAGCEISFDSSPSPTPSPISTVSPTPPPYYIGEISSPLKISKETWSLDIGEKILVQVSGYDPEEHGKLEFFRISHPDHGEIVRPIDGAPAPNGQMYLATGVGSVKIEAEGRRCPPSGSTGSCGTTELGSLFIYVKEPDPPS